MKKLYIFLVLITVLITGCGGGGSGPLTEVVPAPSPSIVPTSSSIAINDNFAQPAILPVGKFRLAKIDYRYDTAISNKNSKGHHTTSYEGVLPMVDQIKRIGFSGVIFQLQTSVNKETGRVSVNDQPDTIKTPPKDLWKLVKYAKSQGLQVWISLQIADSITDFNIVPDFNKFTEQSMFESIAAFDKPIAKLAQEHNVDGIFISEGNSSLEGDEHLPYWKYLIDQIKSVYSGKLSYTTRIITATSIWHHVDYPSIFMSGGLSKTPVYDLRTILGLYNRDINQIDQVASLKRIQKIYGKKLILTLGATVADEGVGVLPSNFFTMMLHNTWSTEASPDANSNPAVQILKIKAFFEITHSQLNDITDGVAFIEFAPWLDEVKFGVKGNPVYKYYCCGWNLTHNTDAQKALNIYLSKPWGYVTVQ